MTHNNRVKKMERGQPMTSPGFCAHGSLTVVAGFEWTCVFELAPPRENHETAPPTAGCFVRHRRLYFRTININSRLGSGSIGRDGARGAQHDRYSRTHQELGLLR